MYVAGRIKKLYNIFFCHAAPVRIYYLDSMLVIFLVRISIFIVQYFNLFVPILLSVPFLTLLAFGSEIPIGDSTTIQILTPMGKQFLLNSPLDGILLTQNDFNFVNKFLLTSPLEVISVKRSDLNLSKFLIGAGVLATTFTAAYIGYGFMNPNLCDVIDVAAVEDGYSKLNRKYFPVRYNIDDSNNSTVSTIITNAIIIKENVPPIDIKENLVIIDIKENVPPIDKKKKLPEIDIDTSLPEIDIDTSLLEIDMKENVPVTDLTENSFINLTELRNNFLSLRNQKGLHMREVIKNDLHCAQLYFICEELELSGQDNSSSALWSDYLEMLTELCEKERLYAAANEALMRVDLLLQKAQAELIKLSPQDVALEGEQYGELTNEIVSIRKKVAVLVDKRDKRIADVFKKKLMDKDAIANARGLLVANRSGIKQTICDNIDKSDRANQSLSDQKAIIAKRNAIKKRIIDQIVVREEAERKFKLAQKNEVQKRLGSYLLKKFNPDLVKKS